MREGNASESLNAICPYFTMFPLSFPASILRDRTKGGDIVLDPFCGRGTTNFAARLLGLATFGFDLSPVAVAAAKAKLVTARPRDLTSSIKDLILARSLAHDIPSGAFWTTAYHPETLVEICRVREALLSGQVTGPRADALRGLMLGALHGPLGKSVRSYLSNQCPRTYAPKPNYALKFWMARELTPPRIFTEEVIRTRAIRYYGVKRPFGRGGIYHGDAREMRTFEEALRTRRVSFIVTSPPYYGLRTYGPDQWLRNWFLGGPCVVDYGGTKQINHTSQEIFIGELRRVWRNAAEFANPDCRMVIRFGAINDRPVKPVDLARRSLLGTGWRIETVKAAGSAANGKRQADTFLNDGSPTVAEFDLWCRRAE